MRRPRKPRSSTRSGEGSPVRDGASARTKAWWQIGAIGRRDLTIQLSYQVAFLLRAQAMFFSVATLVFLGRLVPSHELGPYRGGYFEFALIGLVVGSFTTLGLRSLTAAIYDEQQEGTLEILLASPVRLGVLLTGSMMVPFALAVVEVLIYLVVGLGIVGRGIDVSGALLAIPVFVLTISTFAAVGVLSAAFILVTKRGDPIATIVGQATAFLGGAVFPVALLPGWVQAFSYLVPAYYSLQGLRVALLGSEHIGAVLTDIGALALFTIVLGPLSLFLFGRALRLARTTGTLGTY